MDRNIAHDEAALPGTTGKAAVMQDLAVRKVDGVRPPFYYHIHLYMPCNQKCIMCVPSGRHPKDMVTIDRFRDFVRQIEPHAEHLTLMGGEPLLYPWFDEVIELLSVRNMAVTISTNATHLDGAMIERLLRLPALTLRCSIDAATAETYFRIRGTDRFDVATSNMKAFARAIRGRDSHRQVLVYVVMGENLSEVEPFVELAADIGPHAIEFNPVRHVRDWDVENGTGWRFNGQEQSCESFRDDYNAVVRRAAERCAHVGIECETTVLS